jgi:acetyltransferase
MPSSERGRRAAGLDGLRALAALSVVCFHVWLYRFPDPTQIRRAGLFDDVMSDLRLGLILFFVLSGFLLYRAFARAALPGGEPVDIARYARRRAARILPAYYLAMIGTFALLWGARGTPGVRLPDGADLALFAVFAQNFSTHTILKFNPVTWTLCLEVFFYAVLPLIGLAAYRFGRGDARRQRWILIGLLAFGLAWNAGAYVFGGNMLATKALPAYLPYFALGMLLALWVESRAGRGVAAPAGARRAGASSDAGSRLGARAPAAPRLSRLGTAALVLAGIGGVMANAIWHSSPAADALPVVTATLQNLPAGAGFCALLAAVVCGRGPATGWIHSRPLASVGLVSYGLYLWHVPLMLFGIRLNVLPHAFLPRLAAVLIPALIAGALSWHLVERRALARASRARSEPVRRTPQRVGAALDARAAP